jgi:hypothetical protein
LDYDAGIYFAITPPPLIFASSGTSHRGPGVTTGKSAQNPRSPPEMAIYILR